MELLIKCEICNNTFKTHKMFSRHLRLKHNYSPEMYYIKFLRRPGEGICPCGNLTKFLSIPLGYSKHCSCKCQAQYRDNNTNCFRSKEVQQRIRATKLKKNI